MGSSHSQTSKYRRANPYAHGGFGGGGGSGYDAGGGGGGYTGGRGGAYSRSGPHAYGGSSYNGKYVGLNSGQGKVIITKL